jgi:sirohydrochlorin ferrochelatase
MPCILLIDNGSSRPGSTLRLRRLASALGERLGHPVHPVSLQHADKVPTEALGGVAADTLAPFLRRALGEGERDFLAVPLFFGPSRALSHFIPDITAELAVELGPFRLSVAPELCPLPEGEPRLSEILADQLRTTARVQQVPLRRVVLVDHGSPLPEVNAVRRWLAQGLRGLLGADVDLREAVMERRAGPDYDFNGPLLADLLEDMAQADPETPVILAMLFLAPGRHAGPGGDIAGICAAARQAHPGWSVHPSPLVGEHPGLISILADRVVQVAKEPGGT